MDHSTGLNFLVFLFVLGPLVIFFVKCVQAAGQSQKAIAADDSDQWKDPESYLVDAPSDVVAKIVAETLPQFFYANGNWQIINIEPGMPITIAANLPCIDESDPDNTQRFDLGLITTIIDQRSSGQATRVKMHFIPYEGLEGGLEAMSRQTYGFIQKALKAQDGLLQPLVVQGDDDSVPSDGAPTEKTANFFMQSTDRSGFARGDQSKLADGDTSKASDIDTGDLDVVPAAPQPKWQQASVPEFMPEYHEPSDLPGGSPGEPVSANEFSQSAQSSSASQFMPGYFESESAPLPKYMPDYREPAPAPVPELSPVPEMAEAPDFAPLPEPTAAPDPLAFLNQALPSMSSPVFEPAPFEIPPAPAMPPGLPPAMPSGYPAPASGSPSATDSGTSAGAGNSAGLCPGCSQPINPSFPFCLYCGKNF